MSLHQPRSLYRNIATLVMGAGAGRLLGLAVIPALTRLYSPEQMGVLSVFSSIIGIAAPFLTLRYITAIPIAKTDGGAFNLLMAGVGIAVVVSLTCSCLLAAYGGVVLPILSLETLHPFWPLLVMGVFLTALSEALSLWATRKRTFKVLAKTQFTQVATGSAAKLGFAYIGLGTTGLLGGQVIQQGGGIVALSLAFIGDFKRCRKWLSLRVMWLFLRRFVEFPMYRLPSQILMIFCLQSPVLFANNLYDMHVAGQLGLALMSITLPISLLSTTTGNAYYGEISALGRQRAQEALALTKTVVKRVLILGFLPSLALFFLAPWGFPLIFGQDWELAGQFARVFSIFLVLNLVANSVVHGISVYGNQVTFLRINVARTLGVFGVFLVGWIWGLSPIGTIAIYSAFMAIHYAVTIFSVFKVIKDNCKK